MKRATLALTALLVAGCGPDLGLEGTVPLEEARQAPPSELVAMVHAPPPVADEQIVVNGRLWVPWGLPVEMASDALRSVGSAHGTTVHARWWDRSPYDALFARHDGAWQGYAPVFGRSGGGGPASH